MEHEKKFRRVLRRKQLAHLGPEFEYERQGIFRFTDLPPELRNIIYEYVFSGSTTCLKDLNRGRTYIVKYTTPSTIDDVDFPGLLLASKQLRMEATPIYYANTRILTRKDAHLRQWLGSLDLGFQKLIKLVELDHVLEYFVSDLSKRRLKMYEQRKSKDINEMMRKLQMPRCAVRVRVLRHGDGKVLWPKREIQSRK